MLFLFVAKTINSLFNSSASELNRLYAVKHQQSTYTKVSAFLKINQPNNFNFDKNLVMSLTLEDHEL